MRRRPVATALRAAAVLAGLAATWVGLESLTAGDAEGRGGLALVAGLGVWALLACAEIAAGRRARGARGPS